MQDGDDAGFEVALMDVRRTSGDTVTVKWQYRNKAKEMKRVEPYDNGQYNLASGAYLIDPTNKKKYLVVRDEKDVPIASPVNTYQVQPNEYLNVWAKFPTPPAGVDKISVYLPHCAPFEDVPVK